MLFRSRSAISRDNNNLTGKALNKFINNMDPLELVKYFNGPNSNTYSRDWTTRFVPSMALQKGALTGVASTIPPIVARDSVGYKNGKLPRYRWGTQDEEWDDDEYAKEIEDDEAAIEGYQDARKFVRSYAKSPGFVERLKKGKQVAGFTKSKYNPAKNGNYVWKFSQNNLKVPPYPVKIPEEQTGYVYPEERQQYRRETFPITENGQLLASDYGELFAHELGHALDMSIHRILINPNKEKTRFSGNEVWNGYSRSIPYLRRSKSYIDKVSSLKQKGFNVNENNISSFID